MKKRVYSVRKVAMRIAFKEAMSERSLKPLALLFKNARYFIESNVYFEGTLSEFIEWARNNNGVVGWTKIELA